jgi:hypothetical protein
MKSSAETFKNSGFNWQLWLFVAVRKSVTGWITATTKKRVLYNTDLAEYETRVADVR